MSNNEKVLASVTIPQVRQYYLQELTSDTCANNAKFDSFDIDDLMILADMYVRSAILTKKVTDFLDRTEESY